MTDQEKVRDYEYLSAVAAAGFGLFAECQRLSILIKRHQLEKLTPDISAEKMFNFIQAVDKRGKAHAAANTPALCESKND